ncbi:MAG: N-acetyltransferase family protein [Planctomycetota bacterium]
MLIRDAAADDLAGIFEIYDREVLHGTATFETVPKTPAERVEWLAAHRPAAHPAIVAVEPDHGSSRVLGWATLSAWSARCAYARAAENSVYVHLSARGRGVGRALLGELLVRARAANLAVIIARIAEGNPASVRLHESAGFETIGVMRRIGEKFGRVLDVRMMDLHLDGGLG